MISATSFPGKYIQGYEAIKILGPEISKIGETGFIISSPTVFREILPGIREEIGKTVNLVAEQFGGECCDQEIERLVDIAQKTSCQVVIGMGGGKTLDTAKVVARELGTQVIIVPTIASSDAPCTALAVIHTSHGEFSRLMPLPKNPDVVLVDTKILVQSPVRFLVAGMGDALSAIYEGDSCQKKCVGTLTGFLGSMMAYELCRLTYKILIEYGLMAKRACEARLVIPAVEHVIEANTLLSGLCHENCGAAAPHAIGSCFTVLKEAHTSLHGEAVAFGTLASLFLTDKSMVEIDQVYSFCESIGLPTTLADIGLTDIKDENIMEVAEAACSKGSAIYNEPVPISIESVFTAIKAADFEGRRRKTLKI